MRYELKKVITKNYKFNYSNLHMDKDILKGLKIGFGFFLSLGILFGLVFAVGFHSANEILGGVFTGNFTVNGTFTAPNIEKDISALTLVAMDSSSYSVVELENGFFDSFNDNSGIDITESINETFDNTGFITSQALSSLIPTVSDWTGVGSGNSYGSGQVGSTASGSSYTTNALLKGDFIMEFQMSTVVSDWSSFGVFDTAEVGTIGGSVQKAHMDVMTNSFYLNGVNNVWKGASNLASAPSLDTSNVFQMRRDSGVISLRNKGTESTLYTWAGTYTQDMHGVLGGGNPATFTNINITGIGDPVTLDLYSKNYTSDIQANNVIVTILQENLDGYEISLNSDFLVYVSANGGINWDQVTMTYEGNYSSSIRKLVGETSITNTGSIMKYRILSNSSNGFYLHGVGLTWS